jgi:hypothetical protein
MPGLFLVSLCFSLSVSLSVSLSLSLSLSVSLSLSLSVSLSLSLSVSLSLCLSQSVCLITLCRLWTRGYDVYSPHRSIIAHDMAPNPPDWKSYGMVQSPSFHLTHSRTSLP